MIPAMHLAMHAVAVKKHAAPDAIAAVSGLSADALDDILAAATESGRLAGGDGRYLLSPAGRMILEGEYSRFYADVRTDERFTSAYERFELINKDLKGIVTDWQTMPVGGERVPNDHSNAEYDEELVDRLGDLHERFEPVLGDLVAVVPRLAYYRDKLGHALDQVEDGATEWLSDARQDSYHTVWFELHEELLRIMGRERDE